MNTHSKYQHQICPICYWLRPFILTMFLILMELLPQVIAPDQKLVDVNVSAKMWGPNFFQHLIFFKLLQNNSPHSLRCYHSTVELSLRHFKTYSVIVAYLGVCFLPDYYVSYSQPRDDDLSLFPYNYFIPLTVL